MSSRSATGMASSLWVVSLLDWSRTHRSAARAECPYAISIDDKSDQLLREWVANSVNSSRQPKPDCMRCVMPAMSQCPRGALVRPASVYTPAVTVAPSRPPSGYGRADSGACAPAPRRVLPRVTPSTPAEAALLKPAMGRPQKFDIDMMHQGGETAHPSVPSMLAVHDPARGTCFPALGVRRMPCSIAFPLAPAAWLHRLPRTWLPVVVRRLQLSRSEEAPTERARLSVRAAQTGHVQFSRIQLS